MALAKDTRMDFKLVVTYYGISDESVYSIKIRGKDPLDITFDRTNYI